MRHYEEQLSRLNTQVVVVTFEAGYFARSYVEETGLKWPLLVDDKREVYRAYDMLEAGFWDIWGLKTVWAYLKELAHGRFPKHSEGDVSQRGGDVLIDPAGLVRFHHIGQGPGDRPSADVLLEVLQSYQRKR